MGRRETESLLGSKKKREREAAEAWSWSRSRNWEVFDERTWSRSDRGLIEWSRGRIERVRPAVRRREIEVAVARWLFKEWLGLVRGVIKDSIDEWLGLVLGVIGFDRRIFGAWLGLVQGEGLIKEWSLLDRGPIEERAWSGPDQGEGLTEEWSGLDRGVIKGFD